MVPGQQRIGQRPLPLLGGQQVIHERRRPPLMVGRHLDGVRRRAVQPALLARREVCVERVTNESMVEVILIILPLAHDPRPRRLRQRLLHLLLAAMAQVLEVVEAPTCPSTLASRRISWVCAVSRPRRCVITDRMLSGGAAAKASVSAVRHHCPARRVSSPCSWKARASWRVKKALPSLRWAWTVRPTTLQTLLDRVAVLAQQAKVTHARNLRVDATVVETPIHYPTASGLLGDGVRVLTRLVTRAKPLVQDQLAGRRSVFRNRMRSMRRTLQALDRVVRRKAHTAVAQQRPVTSL